MYRYNAREIADAIGGMFLSGDESIMADDITIDSREVKAGSVFAAFLGENSDGHAYLESAASSGATVLLVSDKDAFESRKAAFDDSAVAVIFVDDMRKAIQDLARHQRSRLHDNEVVVIAVTGSTGKTSTKEFIAAVLSPTFKVISTFGNQNNELGMPLTLLRADETTQVVIVEMGMRGSGQITELASIARPRYGIVTSVGTSHLELLGTRMNIAHAKAELFAQLPSDGVALYDFSDEFGSLLSVAADCRHLTVGFCDHADVAIKDATLDALGLPSARYRSGEVAIDVSLTVPGLHHLLNAGYAAAIALELGVAEEEIRSRLGHAQLSGMRFSAVRNDNLQITFINDAYNANPTSMRGSLRTFAALGATGRKIAVLGDMLELGDYSSKAHEEIGELVAELSLDAVFVYGDFSSAIAAGSRNHEFVRVFEYGLDKMDKLCSDLGEYVRPGDTVLLKASRGLALERIINVLGDFRVG